MATQPATTTDPITEYLQASLDTYLADLEEIVTIDSGTPNKEGVDAVGAAMERRLRELGCEVTRIPHPVRGDSVVATLRGRGDKKFVMVGHLDTVYPNGTAAARPFHIKGDRAYGPGTSDMKNGILAALYAMRALKITGNDTFGELVLFLNADEEMGSPTSAASIDEACEGASAAFVLESARKDGSVVVARKGVYVYDVTVYGRNSHAGVDPASGRSAIVELAHKVVAIAGLNGLSPGTTVNVGTITGGTVRNVVPDRASCEVDVRCLTTQAHVEFEREFFRILSEAVIPDTRAEASEHHCFPPMERNERNEALFQTARTVASRLGFELKGTETGGGSDANHISALGIPVLDGLGPIGRGAHSPDECLIIPSVVDRTSLLAHLIVELSG